MLKTKTNSLLTLLAGLVIGFMVSVGPTAWAETTVQTDDNGCTCTCVCPEEEAANEETADNGDDWTPATSAGVTDGGDAGVTDEDDAGTTDGDGEETAADGVGGDDSVLETTGNLSYFQLNELLPDPEGTDTAGEFIEIANRGADAGDTAGWRIVNASGKVFTLPSYELVAGAELQFPYQETKITLTNDGTTIRLERPDGSVADSVTYPKAPTGQSYARETNAVWGWNTRPTPGAENDAAGFETNNEETSTTADSAATTSTAANTTTETASATKQEATQETPAPEPTPEIDIAVTEFLPRPDGGEEWVEIFNHDANAPAPLDGWKLDDIDGGSSPFALDGLAVPAGGYLVIAKTTSRVALNDDGDTVRLLAPDGMVRQTVTYAKAQLGLAYAESDGAWSWAAPTPGAANAAPAPEEEATTGEPDDDDEETPAEFDAIEDVLLAASVGGKITIVGTVTLPLGKQGKTIFALVDDYGQGYFVRLYGQPLPALRVGDTVRVTGKATERDGALTLSARPADVGVLGHGKTFFEPIALRMLEPADQGKAVLLAGTVSAAGARWFTATDEDLNSETTVRLLDGKMPTEIKAGGSFRAKGVVRARDGGVEILAELADAEFFPAVTSEENTPKKGVVQTAAIAVPGQKGTAIASWLAPLGGAGAAGFAWWRKRRLADAVDLGLDA